MDSRSRGFAYDGGKGFNYDPLNEDIYEGRDDPIELTELPKSHAPSYVSTTKESLHSKDSETAALAEHAQTPSGFDLLRARTSVSHVIQSISRTVSDQNKRRKLHGWRFGVSLSAWTATVVLVLNLLIIIVTAGSCSRANYLTTWLHILINGLSSLLLSASNYTMQALVAPTRAEVDRAHSRGDWMDIGVASIRNLFKIKWHRTALWMVLALSSIPIHLLYNSVVFKSIASNLYIPVVANPVWLEGGNFSTAVNWTDVPPGYKNTAEINIFYYFDGMDELLEAQKWFKENQNDASLVKNMSTSECISTYGTNFVSGNSHVVAIANEPGNSTTNETLFYVDQTGGGLDDGSIVSYECICANDFISNSNEDCDTSAILKQQDWIVNGKKIEYCLSRLTPQHCTVQFSVQILAAVICMNAMKSICMFLALYRQKETTLVTIGDAVASYLERPDDLTAGRCLMERKDISSWRSQDGTKSPNTQPLPKTYFESGGRRWFVAVSGKRWIMCFSLIAVAVAVSSYLLSEGESNLSGYAASPWSIGWGAVDSRAIIGAGFPSGGSSGLMTSVLLANCPQAIVSFLYLLYNGLMTALLLAQEGCNYAFHRKALRVTAPQASQRSTYYLQLPLRYSAPLLVISSTLHWVISQSIFLVRVDVYDDGEPVPSQNVSAVGYSCPPILTAIMIGVLLSFVAIAMGFRKFKSQMPVAGSCSVAIAAACHRPKDDADAAYLPVQWGEVEAETVDETGHCCFTTHPVKTLAAGRMYAGENGMSASCTSILRR
ncbi:Hypothetical predicted protein [Lecanosticta acicola]|uniref:DUF6536 domain-containing protein n=1 Tax=Lecanosticta acicola TaxID=111012 RepID=A0AAI9EAY7_9PEZI|nr:Hypothetical predicted protein [Lecanosticta acicola]